MEVIIGCMEDKMGAIYKQYDIRIRDTYRIWGCTVLNTDKGEFVIKPYEGNETRALIDNAIKTHLFNNGYKYVDIIEANKVGELISYNQYKNPYIIKRMYSGQECDLRNENQVMLGVGELAVLHRILQSLVLPDELNDKIRKRNINEDLESRLKCIKRVRRYIIDKRQKNDFEIEFLKLFGKYINQGEEAVGLMREVNNLEENEYICHGSFDQHSILFLPDSGEITITNFDKVVRGNQILDLYHYLRKTMEKNDWNESLGIKMIGKYVDKSGVKEEELKILKILLQFPEKFWKIANQYYNKRKVWVSEKNYQKINSLNEQEEKRTRFIKAIKEYHI